MNLKFIPKIMLGLLGLVGAVSANAQKTRAKGEITNTGGLGKPVDATAAEQQAQQNVNGTTNKIAKKDPAAVKAPNVKPLSFYKQQITKMEQDNPNMQGDGKRTHDMPAYKNSVVGKNNPIPAEFTLSRQYIIKSERDAKGVQQKADTAVIVWYLEDTYYNNGRIMEGFNRADSNRAVWMVQKIAQAEETDADKDVKTDTKEMKPTKFKYDFDAKNTTSLKVVFAEGSMYESGMSYVMLDYDFVNPSVYIDASVHRNFAGTEVVTGTNGKKEVVDSKDTATKVELHGPFRNEKTSTRDIEKAVVKLFKEIKDNIASPDYKDRGYDALHSMMFNFVDAINYGTPYVGLPIPKPSGVAIPQGPHNK